MVPKHSPPSHLEYKSFIHRVERTRLQAKHIPSVSSQQLVLRRIAAVYTGNAAQAAVLNELFEATDGHILDDDSLVRIAQRICENWEPVRLTSPRLSAFVRFMKFVLSHTSVSSEVLTLEEAVKICACRHSAFPTVHTPLVLLLTLGFLERLSLRYRHAKGEPGCAQRLFLMAYTIAAKYLHANLAGSAPILKRVSESPLLHTGGSSAFRVHPSQYHYHYPQSQPDDADDTMSSASAATSGGSSRRGSVSPSPLPPRAPGSLVPSQSFMIMTATTNFLSRMLPHVTTRELYRMEMEFLVFLEYNVHLHHPSEVDPWRAIYQIRPSVRRNSEIARWRDAVKREVRCEDSMVPIKMEEGQEDQGDVW